jgi:hypothetical protein
MLRLYQPCIPTRSEEAPTGPQWVHEIKHDGYRIIARKIGDRVQLLTKGGHDWAMRYPYILEATRTLKVQLQAKARILPMVLDNAGGGLTEHEEAFYRGGPTF